MNTQRLAGAPLERAAYDEEELLVLPLHRIEQLVAIVGADLPVGEDRGHGAGVGGRLEFLGKERNHACGIGAVLDDQEVGAVVPWRSEHEPGGAVGRRAVLRCGTARHSRTVIRLSRLPSIAIAARLVLRHLGGRRTQTEPYFQHAQARTCRCGGRSS